MPEKKVDKDAICLINVIYINFQFRSDKKLFSKWRTFFGSMFFWNWLNKPWSYICRSYFFTPPLLQISFFEESAENCNLEPREPRFEDEQGLLLGVAFLLRWLTWEHILSSYCLIFDVFCFTKIYVTLKAKSTFQISDLDFELIWMLWTVAASEFFYQATMFWKLIAPSSQS